MVRSSVERVPDGRRLGLVLGLLVLPQFVALGAPSVALPEIGRSLAVPFGATAWILAAWSLTSALAMPVAGRLIGRRGPVPVLVGGIVALAAGSALAAAGPTLLVVVLGRLLGGLGAGAAVIAVLAAATALPPAERGRALGPIAAAGATASACGTLLGGALTAWLGWRAVLGLPVLALPLLLAVVPFRRSLAAARTGSDGGAGGRPDVTGAATLVVLAGAVITLLQAHAVRLPVELVVGLVVVVVLAAAVLTRHVRRVPDGFVPRVVVGTRGLPAAGIVGAGIFAGYYGVLFLAPAMLEQATGGGPLLAGALLVPAAVCSLVVGRALTAVGGRWAPWRISAGLATLTVAGVLVVATGAGPVTVVVGTALAVCGFAGAQPVLVGLVPDLVPAADRDTAQGLLTFLIFSGGAVGPALMAGLTGLLPASAALVVLAVLPLVGLAACVLRRPGARTPAHPAPAQEGSPT
ncbi:MFS transporter [Pseudonocardia alni]|uniref:MFS transporter n=1 Tax=Pseudonocardia alni TaxID=33907 RepID=UPI00280AF8C0|nr:MFS transporter [Pseudonocardia alni]